MAEEDRSEFQEERRSQQLRILFGSLCFAESMVEFSSELRILSSFGSRRRRLGAPETRFFSRTHTTPNLTALCFGLVPGRIQPPGCSSDRPDTRPFWRRRVKLCTISRAMHIMIRLLLFDCFLKAKTCFFVVIELCEYDSA